ncbi:SDR family NAD(P)-dependent oxidoreductase [Fulvivirgaceae bacterium BMA10]|uniref:SDR family NAD(P)-dependent oxidoreductase n=1 Tax=Splendidivirga corallicola TaxID=3051826 RepID=A0ABT8KMH7_9BACT|nr:SDR family NAD(P)-dependent oxidoreductase [Fulvivirgaceae bacterium BMA10]
MNKGKKTVLITGTSQGIGLAIAKKLLDEGFFVIGTSRSGIIEQLSHENLAVLKLDVTDNAGIERAHQEVFAAYDQIDILINNAGIGPDLGTERPEINSFAQTFETNLFGLVFFTEPLLDLIPNNGQVLNISSKMGSIEMCGNANALAYRMSKSALNMYTKILANRLEEKNIKVVSIHPGWVRTNIAQGNELAPLSPDESAEGIYQLMNKPIQTGSFWNVETLSEIPW